MKNIIYLDNSSTTKVCLKVASEMKKFMIEEYGNPSSPHEMGYSAREAIDKARHNIASEIGAKDNEIIFTSSATEANNIAILGIADANPGKRKIVISAIEHASVWEPCQALKKRGYSISVVPVDKEGLVDIKRLEDEIDKNTLMVSVIHGNNEIGVLQDIDTIGNLCKKKGVIFHIDAVQSFGKEKVNSKNIDLISASGHKIGGPKGIGFLYIREGIKLNPIFFGGGQEGGIRPGTENVPGIVGFAKALEEIKKIDKTRIKSNRDYFIDELEKIGGKINGSKKMRLYNNIHVYFDADADGIVAFLSKNRIMCSTKSACSFKEEENRILRAIGLKSETEGTIRFSINEHIAKKDIRYVISKLVQALKIGRDKNI